MSHKLLYAIPTMKCNLNCDHCFIVNTPETFNRDEFIKTLNEFNGDIVLFGGEPTSNMERMKDVVNENIKNGISKISSISTNLTILTDELIEFYKSLHHVSTSWNPHRFPSVKIYDQWIKHCHRLSEKGIDHTIMITLTEDLFEIQPHEFINIAKSFDGKKLSCIKFEHYVGDVSEDYFDRADEWLCGVYKLWDLNTEFEIKNRICNWKYDCNDVYTLYPNGILINRCPHNLPSTIPDKCFTCDKASTCRPCRIQRYCSYPRKLEELIKEEENELSILSSQ